MSVTLIAECHTGHGGSLGLAKEYVQNFAAAGADFCKFQFTRSARLKKTDPQYEWFARAELSDADFAELRDWCDKCGTKLLLTVYNIGDVSAVHAITPNICKVGSAEAMDVDLCGAVMKKFDHTIVALGLCANNIYAAAPWRIDDMQNYWGLIYMGCVTRYPAPRGIAAHVLRPLPMVTTGPLHQIRGWSDHCIGLEECQAAICCGADIIEKHVALPNQARVIQPWESSVDEFRSLRAFADDDPAARFIGRWQV